MFFAGTLFASCSLPGSFFACNILVFKLIYEGSDGVSTCIYLLVFTCIYCYLLLRVYLLYSTGFTFITRRTTPRRTWREECSGEEHDAKIFPRPSIYIIFSKSKSIIRIATGFHSQLDQNSYIAAGSWSVRRGNPSDWIRHFPY